MKRTLIYLFALLNFSNSHLFGEQITIDNSELNEDEWKNGETNIYSNSKEMAPCTCNLTSHCDIYCCCDTKCSEDDIKNWEDNSLCLNKNKKWVEDYMCKNAEETFKYNKNKAGINIRDHIFNIMCIKYDRSCDMVNHYLEYNEETDKSKIEEIKKEWVTKFFGSTETTTRRLQDNYQNKYGQKINKNLKLYKADSNGNCIRADAYFLIPFESSCHLDEDLNTNNLGITNNPQNYGDSNGKIVEITYIIKYSSDNKVDMDTIDAKVLRYSLDNEPKQIKFKVQWEKNDAKQTKKFPSGYLQGNPLKINKKINGVETKFNYGYYFHIYNSKGECITNNKKNDSINPINILFKNNIFVSCKCLETTTPTDTIIYKIYTELMNEDLKFYSSPNANDEDYIKIFEKKNDKFESNLDNKNIKINLIFLTTQKGKENSPYDIIQKVYIKRENEVSSEKIISLSVKFVDFSYSSIVDSKNNKITNSIRLPQELLEKLSE